MNQKAKQIIEERVNKFKSSIYYPERESTVLWILEMFIEHPTKPGYKRQDIEYFIKLLNNE